MLFLLKCLTTLIFFYFISALLHTCMITECIFWSHISTHNYFFFFFFFSHQMSDSLIVKACVSDRSKRAMSRCACSVHAGSLRWWNEHHEHIYDRQTYFFIWHLILLQHLCYQRVETACTWQHCHFLHSVAHPRFHHSDNEIKCAYVAPLQCVPPFQQIEATDISRPHSTLSVQSVVREVHTAGLPDYTNTDKKGKCCQELQQKWCWKNEFWTLILRITQSLLHRSIMSQQRCTTTHWAQRPQHLLRLIRDGGKCVYVCVCVCVGGGTYVLPPNRYPFTTRMTLHYGGQLCETF